MVRELLGRRGGTEDGGVHGQTVRAPAGAKTYEIFASYWPNTTEPPADILNKARKYVASRTLDKVEWENSTLIRGDVAEEVASSSRRTVRRFRCTRRGTSSRRC